MVQWALGVSLLEHQRNEEIVDEAKAEPIEMVMNEKEEGWNGLGKLKEDRKQKTS